jgi:hypothetical protein
MFERMGPPVAWRRRPAAWLGACALLALAWGAQPARADALPAHLPRYDVDMDLDPAARLVRVRMQATWTNPHPTPAEQLVLNAHARYVVPDKEIGFVAKMLELLRMSPGDAMGIKAPLLEVQKVAFVDGRELPFRYEGDTATDLVVPLPAPVPCGASVTIVLEFTVSLPVKQGRYGQWKSGKAVVTYLSNWLPVFAFYGEPTLRGDGEKGKVILPNAPARDDSAGASAPAAGWQSPPFVPWHQPYFNEAGVYRVRAVLPADQNVACTGTIIARSKLPDCRQLVEIAADGVRDFAFLCSASYRSYEGEAPVAPGRKVRVHVLALPEHEFYAKEMVRIASQALTTYSRWFGPYPWDDFTIAEAFFGWNGNECATLVMIDQRVFAMPHVGIGYVEYLVSHETCHQWWYNLVGTDGYRETWMDEAMANYFSHRLLNGTIGKNNTMMRYPRALEWAPNIRREDYRSSGMYGTLGRGENGPIVRDMKDFAHLIDLFNHCYDKGGRVVGMIEDHMGEAAFFDFMRVIVKRYRYRVIRIADFRSELERYTRRSWQEFFHHWLYSTGTCDWAVEKVQVQATGAESGKHVTVHLRQCGEYNEQTTVGFALPDCEGYPVRVPILPAPGTYKLPETNAEVHVEPDGPNRARVVVEIDLPAAPTQVAVDPDQLLIDTNPVNNFWRPPVRWRFTPIYSFLEETDLTTAYDRWNVICGPWAFSATTNDPWYTRSTMLGARAGLYRTAEFNGGAYAAFRTDFRDVVAGIDGTWNHWPIAPIQTGFNIERRLVQAQDGDPNALRAALWARYVFQDSSSLYLPPMHYLEAFTAYQDNFLPFVDNSPPQGVRYNQTATAGLHYRLNYLTPYWDPEGGFYLDLAYEGGVAQLSAPMAMQKLAGQFAFVKSPPDFSKDVPDVPGLREVAGPVLEWFSDSRLAMRVYGATSMPTKGEFFTMGGGQLFRGFDMAQRQGSMAWVASAEWRVPLARGLSCDCCDHVFGLRNVYGAAFYDVGNAYVEGHAAGPTAHAVGGGLRLDVALFSFVERTTLRLDVAKAINVPTPWQFWFGVLQPF